MHYDSAQHGEQRLRWAARFQHGETILPSSSSQPDQPAQPQNDTAAGSNHFDRMEAELKALQQQALATQQSIKKLQTREPAEPYTAILSELPGVHHVDGTILGVASALFLALAILWWYLWQRPQNRLAGPYAAMPKTSSAAAGTHNTLSEPVVTRAPATTRQSQADAWPADSQSWDPSTVDEEDATEAADASSPFAKHDPGMGFDPEAAASEVMRVRKSLAKKRVARAHLNDRDDPSSQYQDSDAELDLDLDLDPAPPPIQNAELDLDLDLAAPPTPGMAIDTEAELDLDLDPWRLPGEGAYAAAEDAALVEAVISFSLPTEEEEAPASVSTSEPEPLAVPDSQATAEPEPMPEPEPSPVASTPEFEPEPAMTPITAPDIDLSTGQDYAITLELAQESTMLGLWAEARELASEVLVSQEAALVSEAQALLVQINLMEEHANQDTIPWDAPR
ncbi:MAG: hypothetical protein V4858_10800 [Pseudomonadota bacterium]